MVSGDDDNRPVVLIVDDEAENLALVGRVLRQYPNLRTLIAVSGAEALDFFHTSRIDIVLTDYLMPYMSGTEMLAKARDANFEFVGILVTAYPEEPAVQEATASGLARLVVAKPWKTEDLELAVQFALGLIAPS